LVSKAGVRKLMGMPKTRKRIKAIGPWARLTQEDLEPLPKESQAWQKQQEKAAESSAWAQPGKWSLWKELPPEYQAALIWAYLHAGPDSWAEYRELELAIEQRPASMLNFVIRSNRMWMARALKKLWPNLLDVHIEKGISVFFVMNAVSIRREYIRKKKVLEAFETYEDLQMETVLGPAWKEILNEGFRFAFPQPELGLAHFYRWLLGEAEETFTNGADLAGLVVPISSGYFFQKRLVVKDDGVHASILSLGMNGQDY